MRAFGRSLDMMAMLAAMASSMTATQFAAASAGIEPYRSRGKGKGSGFMANSGMTRRMRQCNNAFESVGHQGAREMARRVRQREKRDAKRG